MFTTSVLSALSALCVCGSLLWFVVCGLWFVVCGLWFVVCGLWFVVCGLWFVVCGLWFVVCGAVECGMSMVDVLASGKEARNGKLQFST